MRNTTVYINAGGRGTRLAQVASSHPELGVTKALLRPSEGLPTLLDSQIAALLPLAPRNIVVGAGDHAHIRDHVNSTYRMSANVQTVTSQRQHGNGGDLIQAIHDHPDLFAEQIVVVNVDTFTTTPLPDLLGLLNDHEADVVISLTRLTGVPNEGAFWVKWDGCILYDAELPESPRKIEEIAGLTSWRASSAGTLVMRRDFLLLLQWEPSQGSWGLYREVMFCAVVRKTAFAFDNGLNGFVDVGTAETWRRFTTNPGVLYRQLNYGNSIES